MADSPNSPNSKDITHVDLGDDLLQEKTLESPAAGSSATLSHQQIDDLLENARILLNESFTEEAKKVLRRVIVFDPQNITARQKLDEIHELELKLIFGSEQNSRRLPQAAAFAHSEALMQGLDRDLELDFFSESGSEKSLAQSFFGNTRELESFVQRIQGEVRNTGARGAIDLGIAFLEIGFFEIAEKLFESAAQTDDGKLLISAHGLQAYALILDGRGFQASLLLQGWVRDPETPSDDKIEFFYLLGRAYESLKNHEEARQWYLKTRELDPYYRDCGERITHLTKN